MAENPVPQADDETRICAVDDLSEGQSLKFRLRDRGRDIPCFLVRYDAGAQASLPTHTDQSLLSFTIFSLCFDLPESHW